MIRANVMETMNEDYVRDRAREGRAGGARDALARAPNAMLAIVTMLGMDIGIALGGAIFTETVYGLPGPREGGDREHQQLDLPITQGVIVFGTLAIIIFNLIVDIFYAWIDPRIRLA